MTNTHFRLATSKRMIRTWCLMSAALLGLAGLVVSESDTVAAASELTKNELMAKGEEIYNKVCSVCHQGNGMGLPGSYPPLVQGADFDAAPFITRPLEERGFMKDGKIALGTVEAHIEAVVKGIPNSRMFAFASQLDDVSIAAVVTYERNAWGNNSGDVIQPAQVAAIRKK